MNHRTDIDGLRAVAVLSVILAHAQVPFVAGGFLGVDVFFVISGFLITRIIRNDLEAGSFSLMAFYERRARRILPALVLVIAACVPFALWLMLPDFLENFGQSVVATLLFSNNMLLAMTSGYWELESAFKPLLHTWSLGVEEQFYIVFPLFLMLVFRFGRRGQIGSIALLAAVSFALSEYGWRTNPDVSFYLPTSRAWELLAGSLASYAAVKPRRGDGVLSLICLAAVIAPMAAFAHDTPSPSIWSAIPVLGTVGVLLFSRPGTLAWRVLSLRPAVFVGLISYSAYLWHQPVFAIARVASLEPLTLVISTGLIALSLALAALSWRYVETPFRDRKAVATGTFVNTIGAVAMVLIGLGLAINSGRGFPHWTFPNIASAGDVHVQYNERVRQYAGPGFADNGRANVALVGNSFARDIGNVLIESGIPDRANMVYFEFEAKCSVNERLSRHARAALARADVVVLAIDQAEILRVTDEGAAIGHERVCIRRMVSMFAEISRAPVVVFGSKHFGHNINPFGRVPMAQRSRVRARVPAIQSVLNDDLRSASGLHQVDMLRLLGTDGKTVLFYDDRGNPLSPDRMHLTRYGARYVARRLDETKPEAWRLLQRIAATRRLAPDREDRRRE